MLSITVSQSYSVMYDQEPQHSLIKLFLSFCGVSIVTWVWNKRKYSLSPRDFPRAPAIFHRISLLSSQYRYNIKVKETKWKFCCMIILYFTPICIMICERLKFCCCRADFYPWNRTEIYWLGNNCNTSLTMLSYSSSYLYILLDIRLPL